MFYYKIIKWLTNEKKAKKNQMKKNTSEIINRIIPHRNPLLVKISTGNIPAERRSPGRPKRTWSDLNPD